MRANNSNKNLLRVASLAFMFVLVVALVVSGFSFTRVQSPASEDVALAGTQTPSTTFLEIANNWFTFVDVSDNLSNTYVFDSTTPGFTYANWYFQTTGSNNDGTYSDSDGYAQVSNSHTQAVDYGLYAFFKLPEILNYCDFTIDVSCGVSNTQKQNLGDTTAPSYKSSYSLCSSVGTGLTTSGTEIQLGDTITTQGKNYFRIGFYSNVSFYALGTTCTLKVTNLSIKLTINDDPVIVSWNKEASALTNGITYNPASADIINVFKTNRNILGNIAGNFNESYTEIKGANTIALAEKYASKSANIYYKSGSDYLIPSYQQNSNGKYVYVNQATKQEADPDSNTGSYVLASSNSSYASFTKYQRLGDDAGVYYTRDERVDDGSRVTYNLTNPKTSGALEKTFSFIVYDYFLGYKSLTVGMFDILQLIKSSNTAYTYQRGNSYTMPTGVKSITVKPFAYDTSATISGAKFRGVAVTVVVDGKRSDGKEYIESDFMCNIEATNALGNTSKLFIALDGLDGTVPDKVEGANFYIDDNSKLIVDKLGNKYYYTGNIDIVPSGDEDSRGDVDYTYTIDKFNGSDYATMSEYTKIPCELGTRIKLSGLKKGKYRISFTGIDSFGRYGVSGHETTSNYFYFIVDAEDDETPENWVASVKTADGVEYNGAWTNKDILITFNTLVSNGAISYKYYTSDDKTPKTMTSTSKWVFTKEDANPFGYERTYYFTATYESGKTYTFTQTIKFDNFGGYTPASATLAQYSNDGKYYGDILPLDIALNYYYTKADGSIELVENFKGSPMTLYYTVDDGEESNLLVGANGEATIDLFGGQNISDTKKYFTVVLRFKDEAGNLSEPSSYKVNVEPAKLYVALSIDNTVKKFYGNNDKVNEGTVKYSLYKRVRLNGEMRKIDISDLEMQVNYETKYEGKTAGKQNVLISKPVTISYANNTYKDIATEYQLVILDNDGRVIKNVNDSVVGVHEIRQARLTVANDLEFEYVFNGTTNYTIGQFRKAEEDLTPFDIVDGDKADEWKAFQWMGTIRLTQGRDVGDNKKAVILQEGIVLTGIGSENYQLTSASGEVESIPIAGCTITPKLLEVVPAAYISKVYDGNAKYKFTHNDYELLGLCGTDKEYLDIDEMAKVNFTAEKPVVNEAGYTFTYTVTFDRTVKNYILSEGTSNEYQVSVPFTINITPKPVTVSAVKTVTKVFDNTADFGSAIKDGDYSIKGLLAADEGYVVLVGKNGKTASVLASNSAYDNSPIEVTLGGDAGNNYKIVDGEGNDVNTMTFSVRINKLDIKKAVIKGIYAIDENGRYYYKDVIDTETTYIYKQTDEGNYIKYDNNDNEELVETLPDTATTWYITEFVDGGEDGGVAIYNSQRFLLADEIIYAIDYYGLDGKLITLGELDYNNRDIQPVVTQVNGTAFKMDLKPDIYDLKVTKFDTDSCFKCADGFVNTATVSVTILGFSDVKFDGNIYSGNKKVYGYSIPYSGSANTLKISVAGIKVLEGKQVYYEKQSNGTWKKVVDNGGYPVDAGTYKAKFTVVRTGDDYQYVKEQVFTVTSIKTSIVITSSVVYGASYGDDLTQSLEKGKNWYSIKDANNNTVPSIKDSMISFEYSLTNDFAVTIPVDELVAGEYFVRVVFAGDNHNYFGSKSPAYKVNIAGVTFNASDKYYGEGDTFDLIKASDIISSSASKYASDFMVVYLVGNTYKKLSTTAKISKAGAYKYMVIHKSTYDEENDLYLGSNAGSEYLFAVQAKGSSATIYISKKSIDSTYGADSADVGQLNNLGAITSDYIPVTDSGTELLFVIQDDTAGLASNFTSGLMERASKLGGRYKASFVYGISLTSYNAKTDETTARTLRNTESGEKGTATVTLKTDVKSGTKLYYYGADSTFKELKYTNNGDGTISFTVNELGTFIIANNYDEASDKTLAIGLGVGLGVGIPVVGGGIAIVLLKLKKKKKALKLQAESTEAAE